MNAAREPRGVVDQFEKRASTYSGSAAWISDASLINAHIEACGRKSPGHVLELCCGTGMVGRSFAAAGWHVCGVDLTEKMVAEANRFFPCLRGSAENVPFLNEAFDAVVLRQAYFLIANGQAALAEARRVLKHDGVIVLSQTVPFSGQDASWLEKIHRTKQKQLKQFYTGADLAGELERARFTVTATRQLTVRENITRWMDAAPELSPEQRAEVCNLIANAPEPYRSIHRVDAAGQEIYEDWNWVIYTAQKKS